MKTKPIPFDRGAVFADSKKRPAGIVHRIGARLLHEAREALPPTIFFFVGFNFIVLTTNLLVAQYLVAVSNFMLATVAAPMHFGAIWNWFEKVCTARTCVGPAASFENERPFAHEASSVGCP